MMKNMDIRCLSTNALKIIAMISMLIDHIGYVFFPWTLELRYIGRIAFPIYCFLIVEGFFHTKNVGKYLLRLGIFALLSEIPFNLAFARTLFFEVNKNVFFTLFIGLAVIAGAELLKEKTGETMSGILLCVLGMVVANWLRTDYSYTGVVMIYTCYLTWEKRNYGTNLSRGLQMTLLSIFWAAVFLMRGGAQTYAICAIPLLWLYTGKKSGIIWQKLHLQEVDVFFKYLFYAYYPCHLMVIYIIYVLKYML